MQINFNKIVRSSNSIGSIVLEYAKLEQQLNDVENQSFFFQKGIESNRKRFQNLRNSYISNQQYLNENSLDDLIHLKNEKEKTLNTVDWKNTSMITKIWKVGLINDIAYLNEVITIKKVFPTLPCLDNLITNTDELIALVNI